MNLARSLFSRSSYLSTVVAQRSAATSPRSRRFLRGKHARRRLALEPLEIRALLAAVPLVNETTQAHTIAPTQSDFDNLGQDWLHPAFDDTTWHSTPTGGVNGVGFDQANPPTGYAPYIGVDTAGEMQGVTPAAFVRYAFDAANVANLGALTLSMRFDDGFIAWINGTEVARQNAPTGSYPSRLSGATVTVTTNNASYTTYDLTSFLSALQPGANVLAIRGFNRTRVDNDFLVQAKLDGEKIERLPAAVDDAVTMVDAEGARVINVLANDDPGTYAPLNPASVTVKQSPRHGVTSVNAATGSISYIPNANFIGTDMFTYTVRDTFGSSSATSSVVTTLAPHRTFVATDDSLARTWTGGDAAFNDAAWTAGSGGVGYDRETSTSFLPLIGDNVETRTYNVSQSIYIRIPFTLDNPSALTALQLLMRYDDGFVAYINGVQVAAANSPESPTFNSGATTTHADASALLQEVFEINPANIPLRAGTNANILAIHGLNSGIVSSDLLLQPELKATANGAHETNAATVTINVLSTGPTAVPDSATTSANRAVTIPVLANDIAGAAPINPSTVQITQPPAHGTTTVDPATGSVIYRPAAGFSGQDSFFYQVRDTSPSGGTFNQSLVGENATNRFLIPADGELGLSWTQAGFDDAAWTAGSKGIGYDSNPVTDYNPYIGVPTPAGQTPVTVYGRWKFSVADPAAVESLVLAIRADDGFVAYINGVQVAAINAPVQPVFNSQSAAGGPADATVLATPNVFTINLAGLTLLPGANNVLAIHALNSGTASSDMLAQPVLTATIAGQGRLSNTAQVTITIEPSSAPAALADTYTVDEDDELIVSAPFGVLANDLPNPATLTASVVTGPAHGTLVLAGDGSFHYTPVANFAGADSFTYRAANNQNQFATATVSLHVIASPDAIIARPDAYAATANTPLAIGREHDATSQIVPEGAIWRFNDAGDSLGTFWRTVQYDDAAWSAGPAQLGYGDGDEATVVRFGDDPTSRHITTYFRRNFTIADPSTIAALTLGLLRDDGAAVYLNGVEIARSNLAGDADSHTFASSAVTGAAENAFESFDINPALLSAGQNTIAVEVHQSSAGSADLSFDLSVEAVSRPANHGGVLTNDEDPDAGPLPLSAILVADPVHGAVDLAADGTFLYIPDADFVGTDTFTYRAVSGYRQSSPTTVFINVAPASNSPNADLNDDSKVDRVDLAILMRHFGKVGATWAEGDIDHNGKIDLMDVRDLQAQFTPAGGPAASAPAAIIAQARSRAAEPVVVTPSIATLRARRAAPLAGSLTAPALGSSAATDAALSAVTIDRSIRRSTRSVRS